MMRPPDAASYRPEIDGLRAVAVLAVIFHHFFPDWIPGGFVGVDVFFVISGYVITLQLGRSRDAGWSAYLLNFYSRRVKRLLPALLLCTLLTSTAFLLLTTRPQDEVFKTGSLALVGASNLYLLHRASDYFSLQAQLNPFTHTWSLGVEEQFYAVFPFVLALVGFARVKTRHGAVRAAGLLGVLSLLSLIAYVALSIERPQAAFYLMPTRFWELGLGALIAIGASAGLLHRWTRHAGALCIVAFVALLVACWAPGLSPVLATLCATAAASLLLSALDAEGSVFRLLSSRSMVYIGLISYSLYLWHWSLLVLAKWTIGIGAWSTPVLLALTLAIASVSYRFVERPLRYATWSGSSLRTVVYAMAAALPFALANAIWFPRLSQSYNNALPRWAGVRDVEAQPELACNGREQVEKLPDPLRACLHADRTAAKPQALYLVGDSHAAQLVFMADSAVSGTPFQVRFINTESSSDFPQGHIANKDNKAATLDFVVRDSAPGDVVVVAFHRGQLNDSRDAHVPIRTKVELNEKAERFVANMKPYVHALASNGVKVILVRDTPLMGAVATSPTCLLQIRLFGQSVCRVKRAQDLHTRVRQDLSFDALEAAYPNVSTWDPLPYIYGSADSLDVVDEAGRYVMWDWNHVTARQSEMLAPWFRRHLMKVSGG